MIFFPAAKFRVFGPPKLLLYLKFPRYAPKNVDDWNPGGVVGS